MSRVKIAAAFHSVPLDKLSQAQKDQMARIKDSAAALAVEFFPTDGREKSLAMTKLEESVMWAIKGVCHS